ncbi:MAG: bifunctional serine/threonine-protein kinase/formylglycine-generating enzyme family protein [Byssovorax sp.]
MSARHTATRRVRAIAEAALARGMLAPQAAWDLACRWALGGASTAEQLYAGVLTEEQIEQLAPSFEHGDGDRITAERIDLTGADLDHTSSPAPRSGERADKIEVSPLELDESRYRMGEPLGVGGVGKVVRARDRVIGRTVALKTIKEDGAGPPEEIDRFVLEARITAQLEHPNIVPVYDIGTLPSGRPYYTMRVVKRQSLQDVLASDELHQQWPLARLIGAFVQISRALGYAHRRGMLHRDIKPENILLGDFGEVYLADWGNAKAARTVGSDAADPVQVADAVRGDQEPSGLSGTPGYIAPEQIRGDKARVDHRSDLFALGVVLYEILTGEHPFDAPTVLGVILATQTRAPRPPREIVPSCPLILEDLCLAMLAKDPALRPDSAERVAAEAESYLEGAKERTRRRDEAKRLCELAKVPVLRGQSLQREREQIEAEARHLLEDVKGYEPIDRKRPGWTLEDRAKELEREQAAAMAQAIELYTKSLAYDPELVAARAGLADLYWSRATEAAAERRPALQVYDEALVAEYDVGRYAAMLKADAMLSIESSAPGAVVMAYRYVEKDRVLIPTDQRYLGRTPLREVRLAPGSYLIVLRHPRFRDVRYPVLLARGDHHRADVNLYTDAEIGADFIYIPGGRFVAGGDVQAPSTLPRMEVDLPDFAIARFPVTFREYCAFLDALQVHDPEQARRRAPHDLRGSEGYAARLGADGKWEPRDVIIEGEARKMFPIEEGHLWNVPVPLVDWFDAVAYCRWRSEVAGAEIRLPLELEWEKAARGVDGRAHPWGDHFDPTFCLMRSSRPFLPQIEPVGTFAVDSSPYQVRDMAGGMREWMADVYGEQSWAETAAEDEPSSDLERGASPVRLIRSGNWVATEQYCRSAARSRFFALTRGTGLSFRVAKSLGKPRRTREERPHTALDDDDD